MTDLSTLKSAAESASHEWEWEYFHDQERDEHRVEIGGESVVADCDYREADAKYIALAQPRTVLALIAELERLQAIESAARRMVELNDNLQACFQSSLAMAYDGNTTRAVWRQISEQLAKLLENPTNG